jgi:methanogenic corrinoid protein MtbC1
VLVAVYPALMTAPARSRERVLLASVEGEEHVVGLRMVAAVLEGAGFEVHFVGANVPMTALTTALGRHRPRVVGLSNTLALDEGRLAAALEALRAADPDVAVMVGGAGCTRVDDAAGSPSWRTSRASCPRSSGCSAPSPDGPPETKLSPGHRG